LKRKRRLLLLPSLQRPKPLSRLEKLKKPRSLLRIKLLPKRLLSRGRKTKPRLQKRRKPKNRGP